MRSSKLLTRLIFLCRHVLTDICSCEPVQLFVLSSEFVRLRTYCNPRSSCGSCGSCVSVQILVKWPFVRRSQDLRVSADSSSWSLYGHRSCGTRVSSQISWGRNVSGSLQIFSVSSENQVSIKFQWRFLFLNCSRVLSVIRNVCRRTYFWNFWILNIYRSDFPCRYNFRHTPRSVHQSFFYFFKSYCVDW